MYPALAVIHEIKNSDGVSEILWVGGYDGIEKRLVERENIPFRGISASGIHGVGLKKLPGALLRLARGFFESIAILRSFDPDVLFFTGGYVGFPVALAGLFRKKVIFVPDIEPALVLTALGKIADEITVVAEESRTFLPKRANVTVTGYPTRSGLTDWSRERAREFFELTNDLPTLFVFGGSKGAQTINKALLAILPEVTAIANVIHVTGTHDWETIRAQRESLPEAVRANYRAYPYLHEEMGAAFRAADLILSRAGASTIGEFPLFGTPAILVPYPYAWRYQRVNAEYLVKEGAAVLLNDENMNEELLPLIMDLIRNQEKRETMSAAMRSLAKPDAARKIAEVILTTGACAESKRTRS